MILTNMYEPDCNTLKPLSPILAGLQTLLAKWRNDVEVLERGTLLECHYYSLNDIMYCLGIPLVNNYNLHIDNEFSSH